MTRAARTPPWPVEEIADRYARYEREKRRRGLADFDDLLWWCADALERDGEFAAAQRWRFRHLFVDEFQDVSPAQLRVVRGWLGDRAELCVVGDADQAIYGFGGADPRYLRDFPRHFRGATALHLSRNYRSTPQIVTAAEAVLRDADSRRPPRVGMRPAGLHATVHAYNDEDDEARGIAARLRDAHRSDVPWSSLAVLYRTNAQSAAFEAALGAAGVPYRVHGAGAFLRRPEVRAALDTLRRAARGAPGRPFADHLVDLQAIATDTEPGSERVEHIEALVRLGREYLDAEAGPGNLDGFDAFLAAALRDEAPGVDTDAVELLTFHRAKGLEFHTVFVTGLERGLVPISYATTPDERAEERRLLYVALSRAEVAVHCSWARSRSVGLRALRRTPSPWLAPIEAARDGTRPAPRPGREGLTAAKAALAATNGDAPDTRRAAHRVAAVATQPGPGIRGPRLRDLPRHHPAGGRHDTTRDPRRAPRTPRGRPGEAGASRRRGPRARPQPRLSGRPRRHRREVRRFRVPPR